MASFESPSFNQEKNHELFKEAAEDGVDMRNENEIFRDHERLEQNDNDEQSVMAEKDQLAEEKDGILYVKIPNYDYDTKYNPFLGMGPHTIRLYSIARYLDVTFLHRFMYGNILVRGIRSGQYVPIHSRAKFVENIRRTGDLPIISGENPSDDFEALRFAPYVASDSTMPVFENFHKSKEHAGDRPHYPVDVWLVYDAESYEQVSEESAEKTALYRLIDGYERKSTLLSIAVIN